MLEFDAVPFYQASLALATIRTNLRAKEKEHTRRLADGEVEVTLISEPVLLAWLKGQVKDLTSSLDTLGARVTLLAANRLLSHLGEESLSYADLIDFVHDIEGRLKDELSLTKILVVERERMEYFEPSKALFGDDFADRFSLAGYEVDEAAKCYALSRPTACVFHLMRTMEIVLPQLRVALVSPILLNQSNEVGGVFLRTWRRE